jgi:1,4-dihydroxy-2-naphthoate octaprenyltransferase
MNKNSFAAWIEAARPKTLPASLSPVIVACALAYRDGMFQMIPALLCFAVALLAQIASNFANDYFDFKKGADTAERLGPERAVAQGWITPKAMLTVTLITLGLACLCGLCLLFFARWELLFVGVAIALCVLAYSAGPFPLAYNGLGDVCVLLFYGIIPVCFTYYVQALAFTTLAFIISLAVGCLSINILLVNNYRDYEQDKKVNKRTTVVLFGRKFARIFYLVNLFIAIILGMCISYFYNIMFMPLLGAMSVLLIKTWKDMLKLEGRELNKILGQTARNLLLYSLFLSLTILIS